MYIKLKDSKFNKMTRFTEAMFISDYIKSENYYLMT